MILEHSFGIQKKPPMFHSQFCDDYDPSSLGSSSRLRQFRGLMRLKGAAMKIMIAIVLKLVHHLPGQINHRPENLRHIGKALAGLVACRTGHPGRPTSATVRSRPRRSGCISQTHPVSRQALHRSIFGYPSLAVHCLRERYRVHGHGTRISIDLDTVAAAHRMKP